jgi:anti-sigma factor ChrR (cupin superfamily)
MKEQAMLINAAFDQRASVHFRDNGWVASPVPGVERLMLDRIGEEVARATSIVRYASGSRFPAHSHDGGEEFLVLEGVFQDEHGDYPVGTYVRNPPGTAHEPASGQGCKIFVKLRQFADWDLESTVCDTSLSTLQADPRRPGVSTLPLHTVASEQVRIESWEPGRAVAMAPEGGLELLCLQGNFEESGEAFTRFDWLRLPPGAQALFVSGAKGCRVWVKEGHLAFAVA